jgi:hypothetical protein
VDHHYQARTTRDHLFFIKIVAVLRKKRGPLLRQIILEEDRLDRANLGADTTVDAFVRIDEVLVSIVIGMDAVDWADLDAGPIFQSDAWFGDDIGHRGLFLSIFIKFVFKLALILGQRPPTLQSVSIRAREHDANAKAGGQNGSLLAIKRGGFPPPPIVLPSLSYF